MRGLIFPGRNDESGSARAGTRNFGAESKAHRCSADGLAMLGANSLRLLLEYDTQVVEGNLTAWPR